MNQSAGWGCALWQNHRSHPSWEPQIYSQAPKLTFLALVGTKPLKLHGDVDFYVMPQFPSHLLTPGCPRGDNSTHPHQGLLVPPAPPCLPDLLPAGANCSFLIFISVINNLDRTQNNFFFKTHEMHSWKFPRCVPGVKSLKSFFLPLAVLVSQIKNTLGHTSAVNHGWKST